MNDAVKARLIPERVVPARRLGRTVEHDPRSRAYPVEARRAGRRDKVLHHRGGSVLDQGHVGSCTGNAVVGALMTDPVRRPHHNYGERTALRIYRLATVLDEFPGQYPADDTGSSGLAACKAAQQLGLIGEYRHAFGIDDALDALQDGPVITGVNWYEGFDDPQPSGFVGIAGQVRGGHEFEVVGYDPGDGTVEAVNSWGSGYGLKGRFRFYVDDWARLLDEDGDATVLSRA